MILDYIDIEAADAANGSLTLHGVAPTDSNAAGDLSGLTLEAVRFEGEWQPHSRPRGYSQGGFVSPGERGEVSIDITGQAWGHDRADANLLYRRLIETLQPDGDELPTLTFTPGDYGPVQMKVALRRIRATGNGPATVEFRAEVVSEDGIAHGTSRSVQLASGSGPVFLPNDGNAHAYPTFLLNISGGADGDITLSNSSGTVSFTGFQSSGAVALYHTQPGRERFITGSTLAMDRFPRPRIGLSVPPGGDEFVLERSPGPGTVGGPAQYRDAWKVA